MTISRGWHSALVLVLLAAPAWGAAWAADVPGGAAAAAKAPAEMDVGCDGSVAPALGRLGDPTGLRQALARKGVSLCATYTGEVMGNVSGGLRRSALYQDKFEFDLDVDLDKLAGWPGASVHVSGLQIDGNGLSGHALGNILGVSNIEAPVSSRLFELWFQQALFGDRVELRLGQLGADSSFAVSDYAGLFMNPTFGFPALLGADLPNGGPAYPFATPGAQLTIKPFDNFSLMAAIFNGDAIGPKGNCCGVNFRTDDPPLYMAEAKYSYRIGAGDAGLPGAVHLGGWYHAGNFADLRFNTLGLPLAGGGTARLHQGDGGVYAMIDQMLYRVPGTDDHGVGAFFRIAGAPGDRNAIDFYVDGGFTYKGLVPGRGDDTIGLAAAFAKVSGAISGFDRDTRIVSGINIPIHDYEAAIELTYQFQVVPGWSIQPDFQYIFHPGGHVAATPLGTRAVRDAAVFGLRTTIQY